MNAASLPFLAVKIQLPEPRWCPGNVGGQNCHVDIEFADVVVWIARIRLENPMLPPSSVQAHIFLSEVATLQFLAETKVPAPRVYAFELASPNNPVGISYILMEKASGEATQLEQRDSEPERSSTGTACGYFSRA